MAGGDQVSEDGHLKVDSLRKLLLFGLELIPQEEVAPIRHRPLRTMDVREPFVVILLGSTPCNQ